MDRGVRANKPSSVIAEAMGNHFSGIRITANLVQPTRDSGGASSSSSLLGLAPDGVYQATDVTASPVRSYRTLSPLPVSGGSKAIRTIGGLLSVALSIGSRRPGVTRHPALRSSDFPPAAHVRQRFPLARDPICIPPLPRQDDKSTASGAPGKGAAASALAGVPPTPEPPPPPHSNSGDPPIVTAPTPPRFQDAPHGSEADALRTPSALPPAPASRRCCTGPGT